MFRIGNAAGLIPLARLDQVEKMAKSAATDITIGPFRKNEYAGNTGDTYYFHPVECWSLNSKGLPGPAWATGFRYIQQAVEIAHRHGKTLRVTVVGFTPEEYAFLAALAYAAGADEVELNLGCPNVWGPDGTQKPIPSYDPALTAAILAAVKHWLPQDKKVDVKISPVENGILHTLAAHIVDSGCVANIVAVNTLPNQEGVREEDGKPALTFNDGKHMGGLAGAPLKKEGLRVVRRLREILPMRIGIKAAGGILNGNDAFEYLEAGAAGLQVGTAYGEWGEAIFSDILGCLASIPEAGKYLQEAA